MNSDISPDNNQSVEGRDYKFETEVMERMYGEYVQKYINRILLMDKEKTYVHDDSFHNVKSHNHIMYKCIVGPNGGTKLLSDDGKRGYEFLVEFDKDDPEYGIYYGCRGLINSEDQQEQIDIFLSEWENYIKPEVCAVLNNTFIDIDFTNRFQATNNASNKTFWPFWIALGEDEDVVKVAARATKLIANVYKYFLDGNAISNKICKSKKINIQTHYTVEAYNEVLEHIKKECGNEVAKKYKSFISKATNKGVLQKDNRFEICWKFKKLKIIEIAYLIRALCPAIGLKPNKGKINENNIPWEYFIPLFLSKDDKTLENLSKQYSSSKSDEIHKKKAKRIIDELGIYGK